MATSPKRDLVRATEEKMRDLIFAQPPETNIGALPDLAKLLGVGIVTVQQAARVLEHEGLLAVRRGPGGGYYGVRPGTAALERSVAAYLRVHGSDGYEALEMMTLVDCELMPAAARCTDDRLHAALQKLVPRIDTCVTGDERLEFETVLHDALFEMVDRPLMELLGRVSMRYYRSNPIPVIFDGSEGIAAWRRWRHGIVEAILARDPERARFEAERHRRHLLKRLAAARD